MIETQILIIGGGPAGATLAKELSLQGITNILAQRNFNFKKPCGGGIRVDAFKEFDLDKKYIKHYINEISLIHKKNRIDVDIAHTPLSIVERREFDAYLRSEAQKHGTHLYEATYISCEVHDEYIISTLKIKESTLKVKSTYLVAADGVNSKLRKQINGDRLNASLTHYTDISRDDYSPNSCEIHFGSKVAGKYYAWAFPENEGTNIGAPAIGKTPYMKNFMNSLEVEQKTKINGYGIPEFPNTLFYKKRTFFVGDSAAQVLPFTFEGIYYAMSSAKILSSVLIDNADPSEYEKRWNAKHLSKFNSLLKLQKIFLANEFMIGAMMRLYRSKNIQKAMVKLWLGDDGRRIDFIFLLRQAKRIFFEK